LTALVNDLLDISKLKNEGGDTGKMPLNISEFDLTASISEVVDRYSKLLENKYDIIFEHDENISVRADKSKILQVIYNLLSNAITYTGEDKRVVVRQSIVGINAGLDTVSSTGPRESGARPDTGSSVGSDAGEGTASGSDLGSDLGSDSGSGTDFGHGSRPIVRIEIMDTGEGISKEMMPNIWERYYRSQANHKRAVIGSGIGLSIVKEILDMHKARYGVYSKQGEGSVFWFELRIANKN